MTDQCEATHFEDDASLPDKFVTRGELLDIIKQVTGLTFTPGTMNQLCSPARGEGPEVEGYIGRRPFYSVKKGLAWAKQRLRHEPYRLHPSKEHSQELAPSA
jgi:hypothetical protein